MPAIATAASFSVNTVADLVDDNTDDGICHTSLDTCSLRAAIMQANHSITAAPTSILLPAGTYSLTRPINGVNGEDNGDLNLTLPNTGNQFIALLGAGTQRGL
jgi:CSLREA domain-containing protein